MDTISLVIPAFNEEERLPALLDVLATSASRAVADAGFELTETLIVDDGSDDATEEILREAEGRSDLAGLIPVLDFEQNQGKGAAVAAGARAATGDYLLFADVDLSTPLEELSVLAEMMRGGADVVIGSRSIEGAIVERGPIHRKLTGKAFNVAVRLLTGLVVHDTQCGFKLMRTEVARELFAVQTCPGFAFDVELLMRAEATGLTIAEVPVLYHHDARSSVHVVSASLQMLRDICGLTYRLRIRGSSSHRLGRNGLLGGKLPADDSD